MARLPEPLSRHDRQRQTREALIFAARRVFSEDGYHAATLERIAREAGFSKGAVYSNFDDKSALFLAVMDSNLALAEGEAMDPFERQAGPASTGRGIGDREGYSHEATQGFALATLEFIARAARDEQLAAQMHHRLAALLDSYTEIARAGRPDDEVLSAPEVGTLLAALDQGAGLIELAGGVVADTQLFNAGMRRLVDPARASAERE